MSKLQLYMAMSYNGYQPMVDINRDEAVAAAVTDVTDALKLVTYDSSEKNVFYMLRSTASGVFIIILRTIPDNPGDHLAAWIFVPQQLVVADDDINNVVASVVEAVLQPKISNDEMERLRRVFDREYETSVSSAAIVANHGIKCAHRFYGGSTGYELSDMIGSKRYQTSYLPYSGVLLVDKTVSSQVAGPNLTDDPLDQMVKIYPPKLDGSTYRPLIFGQPFEKPFLVPLMGTVEIVWKSDTAVDVHQSIMISKQNMRPDCISAPASAHPVVKPAPAPAAPAKAVEPQAPAVEVAPPADPAPAPAQAPAPVPDARPLVSDRHVYNFEVPAKSADISGMIHFEVKSRTALTGSPIDGYELTEPIQEGASRSNHLIYTGQATFRDKMMWLLAGTVVGIVAALLCTCAFGGSGSKSQDALADSIAAAEAAVDTAAAVQAAPAATATQPAASAAPTAPADRSLAAAIAYLDNNKVWTKSELEAYPDLKGLYNDLNTFNHKQLYDVWGVKLKESRSFAKVAEHSKLGQHKKPRTKAGRSTFNPADDEKIVVRTYVNTIDP